MKCYFDGQLKSQDTVLLHLFKRMYPKWTLDPFVPRPLPLYTFHSAHHSDSDEDDEEGKEKKRAEDQEPASKRSKMVKFFSWDQIWVYRFLDLFIMQWERSRERKSEEDQESTNEKNKMVKFYPWNCYEELLYYLKVIY